MLGFVSLGMIVFLLMADTLIECRPFAPRHFWALFDAPVQAILALLVVFPLIDTQAPSAKTVILAFTVLLTGTLLDVDHFIAARSLRMSDILTLPVRPATHSLAFAGALGTLVILISKNPILSWIVFAALASHGCVMPGEEKHPSFGHCR